MITDILKRSALTLLLALGIGAAGIGAANAHGRDEHSWQGNTHGQYHASANGHWKHKHEGHGRWKHDHYRQRWTGRYYDSRHADHRHQRQEYRVTHVEGGLNVGTLLGGVAGGIIGNQFGSGRGKVLATVSGALIGGIVGDSIYRDIRARDEANVNSALETVPTGRTVTWTNPDTGNQFAVQPTRTFRNAASQDCRDYTTWVFVDGYEQEVAGTACRDQAGRWQLASR